MKLNILEENKFFNNPKKEELEKNFKKKKETLYPIAEL